MMRSKVIPPEVQTALENCSSPADLPRLAQVCHNSSSSLARLTLLDLVEVALLLLVVGLVIEGFSMWVHRGDWQ